MFGGAIILRGPFGWSFSCLDSVAAAIFFVARYQMQSSVQATQPPLQACHAKTTTITNLFTVLVVVAAKQSEFIKDRTTSPIKFHFDILICNFVVKFNVCERLLKERATEKPLRFMSLVLYIIISRVWLDGLAAAKINICGDRAFGQNNNCNLL